MSCIVCGNNQTKKLYNILLQCLDCQYVWANLDISNEKVKELYGNNYFMGEEYVDYVNEEKVLKKSFKRNLKLVSKFCSSGRMLEIGCAYGFFLDLAQEKFEVQGIEINEDACKHAQEQLKLDVTCGTFLEQEFPENSYDIVVMWATLEHLKDPDLYIKKINSVLKKGGVFICTVPDIGSFLAKMQKGSWRQIHPPTHLNYFTKSTLSKLLNNHGLKVINTKWLGEYRTINNALYIILVLRKKMKRFYAFLRKLKLNRGSFYLNTYDELCTIAVK